MKWLDLDWLDRMDAGMVRWALSFVVVLVGYLLYRVAVRSLAGLVRTGQLKQAMAGRLRALMRLAVLAGTLVLALHQAGAFDNAWAVLTALFTTIAVGFFAMWSVLSNVVCALLLVVFRPFQVGDTIELLEGSAPFPRGRVLDMNMLFVALEETLPDGAVAQLQIPNTLFFQKVVRRLVNAEPSSVQFGPPPAQPRP